MVFQDARLFPHLHVRGNLDYARRRSGADARAVARQVEIMGIGHLLDRRPGGLSGGERQRVAVARALLSEPQLLLLDEPLAAVDAAARGEIVPYLDRLTRELALPVVYVSHNLDEVCRLADDLVLMTGGRVTARGELREMLARVDLPITRREDVGAVLDARFAERLPAHHLVRAEVAGQSFYLPLGDAQSGQQVRIRVHARDVSLTLVPPRQTSILNVLRGHVSDIADDAGSPGQCLVRVAVGDVAILAWVSQLSRERLALEPGREVYAQVKAAALA
jgi:molybdate transport system ATP-binding protein